MNAPPPVYHRHFNVPTKSSVTAWKSSLSLPHSCIEGGCTFMVSGSVAFVKKVCSQLPDIEKVIACFGVNFENSTGSRCHFWPQAMRLCDMLGISQVTLTDMQFGGGTNDRFLFGFGSSLGETCLPEAHCNVQYSLM